MMADENDLRRNVFNIYSSNTIYSFVLEGQNSPISRSYLIITVREQSYKQGVIVLKCVWKLNSRAVQSDPCVLDAA